MAKHVFFHSLPSIATVENLSPTVTASSNRCPTVSYSLFTVLQEILGSSYTFPMEKCLDLKQFRKEVLGLRKKKTAKKVIHPRSKSLASFISLDSLYISTDHRQEDSFNFIS